MWVCGFEAHVQLFYTRDKKKVVGLRIKPASMLVSINTYTNPHPIGFLLAGTRIKCARCHP